MRNQIQTYFLPDDESAFSQGLRNLLPTIFFVDQGEAGSEVAEVYTDLNACSSGFSYIWDAETDDATVALEKWNELVRRQSGDNVLMQFLRSRIKTEELVTGETVDVLLSGRVAMMGNGTEKQRNLKTRTYKIMSSVATSDVFPVSPKDREPRGPKHLGSRVGLHAVDWCNDPTHLLRHSANPILYGLPAPQKAK